MGCSGFSSTGCRYTYNLEGNSNYQYNIIPKIDNALKEQEKTELMKDSRFSSIFIESRRNGNLKTERSKYENITIYNVIFDFETEKTVKFRREYDSKILWLPKSCLENQYIKDRKTTQDVQLKFKPKNLHWREK